MSGVAPPFKPGRTKVTLFTRLSADFFEQAKVRDPTERYIDDFLVHSLNVLDVEF